MNHRTVKGSDAFACLDHLEAVLDDLQRQCEAGAPETIPAILAHERRRFYVAMDALGGALNEFLKEQSSTGGSRRAAEPRDPLDSAVVDDRTAL